MDLNEFQRGVLVGVAVSLAVWYVYLQPPRPLAEVRVERAVVGGSGAVQVPIGSPPAANLRRSPWSL